MCFQILGFDIILDENTKPWLLEVNHAPSFATESPLDQTIKYNCIRDAIALLGISPINKDKYSRRVR